MPKVFLSFLLWAGYFTGGTLFYSHKSPLITVKLRAGVTELQVIWLVWSSPALSASPLRCCPTRKKAMLSSRPFLSVLAGHFLLVLGLLAFEATIS